MLAKIPLFFFEWETDAGAGVKLPFIGWLTFSVLIIGYIRDSSVILYMYLDYTRVASADRINYILILSINLGPFCVYLSFVEGKDRSVCNVQFYRIEKFAIAM